MRYHKKILIGRKTKKQRSLKEDFNKEKSTTTLFSCLNKNLESECKDYIFRDFTNE